MAVETFEQLCHAVNRPSLLSPSGVVCALGGQPLDVIGETEVRVSKAGPITVLVTRSLPHELILGSDAIERGKGILDYETETLWWYGIRFPLYRYPDSACAISAVSIRESTGYSDIDTILARYSGVFSDTNPVLGYCDVITCTIDTGDSPPLYQRPYRTPLAKRKIIDDQIDQMLRAGVIQPTSSPWASPVTLVPKSDGTYRFCCDFRRLNSVTRRDRYPAVLVQDIFDQLHGATIFTTLDLQSGYWQIPVAPEDQPKLSFVCHRGQFSFTRMPFGISNGCQNFQRAMDEVLRGLIGVCCFVYLDDIVIYSQNPEAHAHHLELVLQRLQKAGLRVKTKKCTFACEEVPLLGYIVNKDGIRPHPDKTAAIAQMPPPKSLTEVRRFLGMCGYYRQTVPNYAEIARPLVSLTHKHTRWDWTPAHETAFRTLQQLLLSDSVLMYPRVDQPYKLYTDASAHCVGGILTQTDDNGTEKVIQYVSQQLDKTQQKWAAIEREAYAIVYCLKKLRPYLWGAEFEIYTDHKPLRALFMGEVANTRVQRWAVLIAEYGAPIKYREGQNNIRADFLSRLPPPSVDVIDTAAGVEPQTGTVTWTLPLRFDGIDKQLLSTQQQKEFPDAWKAALDPENEEYQVQDGVLYSCRRPGARQALYPRVLLPTQWQQQVIDRCHKQTGHAGTWRTLCAIREAYVWPGMQTNVNMALKLCAICQLYKSQPQRVPFTRMPDPRYPHQIVSMDITGPFTRSDKGNVYLLNLVDHLTGWADCYPLSNKRGETIANVLQRDYFPRYGSVECLISDNGGEFRNADLSNLLKACDVEHRTTTPYRPQANAKVERFHRTLKGILERLMAVNSSRWEAELPTAITAYRNTVSGATNYTPFQALYGRPMRVPLTKALRDGLPGFEHNDDRVATLARTWAGAREALRQEREANEAQQKRKRLSGELHVGDLVIVLLPGMKRTFQPRWDARWQVIRTRHPVYWIRHLPTGQEKVLHREKLRWVSPNVDWTDVADRTGDTDGDPLLRPQSPDLRPHSTNQHNIDDCQPGGTQHQPSDTLPLIGGPLTNQSQITSPNIALPHSDTHIHHHTPQAARRRYPARKRRPPQRLEWHAWPEKRGRLGTLDFWAYCRA